MNGQDNDDRKRFFLEVVLCDGPETKQTEKVNIMVEVLLLAEEGLFVDV